MENVSAFKNISRISQYPANMIRERSPLTATEFCEYFPCLGNIFLVLQIVPLPHNLHLAPSVSLPHPHSQYFVTMADDIKTNILLD